MAKHREPKTCVCEAVTSIARVQSILSTLQIRDDLNNMAFFFAGRSGDVAILDVLLSNKRPTQRYICTAGGVAGGKIETLSWVLDNGFPLDRFVCHRAASAGDFEMLNWALERGCPYDEELLVSCHPNYKKD